MPIKEQRFCLISLVFSCLCLLISTKIQVDMYMDYQTFLGKTKAFLGVLHFYRYFYGILGGLGLLFSLVALFKKEDIWWVIGALVLALVSIQFTFMNVWRCFIH